AQIVAAQHRHDVGHDESEERQVADDDGDDSRGDGHEDRADEDDPVVVEADVRRDLLAQAGDGEAIGGDEHGDDDEGDDPQHLVLSAQDRGEAAGEPDAQALEHVRLDGYEGRDRPDHRSEHDADDRHDERGLERDAAEEEEEDDGADERGDDRSDHPREDRGVGVDDDGEHETEPGPFRRARRRRFDEAVLGQQLHDEPAHRHRRAREDEGDGARDTGDLEHLRPAVTAEDVIDTGEQGGDEQSQDTEDAEQELPVQQLFHQRRGGFPGTGFAGSALGGPAPPALRFGRGAGRFDSGAGQFDGSGGG